MVPTCILESLPLLVDACRCCCSCDSTNAPCQHCCSWSTSITHTPCSWFRGTIIHAHLAAGTHQGAAYTLTLGCPCLHVLSGLGSLLTAAYTGPQACEVFTHTPHDQTRMLSAAESSDSSSSRAGYRALPVTTAAVAAEVADAKRLHGPLTLPLCFIPGGFMPLRAHHPTCWTY